MTDRITNKDVEGKVVQLEDKTGREYSLERWSPGDGWSRNQLLLKGCEGGYSSPISNVLNTREMYHFLEGYIEISTVLEREKGEDEREQ